MKTIHRIYLLKNKNYPIERIQHMYMRVAVALHGNCLSRILETYDLMSRGLYTHGSSTLVGSGLSEQYLISSFVPVIATEDPGAAFKSVAEAGEIFIGNGGIGLDMSAVPAAR